MRRRPARALFVTAGRRVLALVTDAYGGRGGIASYARDSIAAMAADERIAEVVVIPRLAGPTAEPVPAKVRVERRASGGGRAYMAALARLAATGRYDAVWVNHLNLAPFGLAMARRSRARLGLVLHGIEAWTPSSRWSTRVAARKADVLLPVSRLTLDRFRQAYALGAGAAVVSPGSVDLHRFLPGPRNDALARRLGVAGRRVITTLGRLDPAERDAKGFGRVIDALPCLIERWPDLVYLIGGDGGARADFESRARRLGIGDRVIFAGAIDEREKPDFLRLSDAFVLPSVGEGLGLVLLEAMACGVPAVASNRDGGREAVAGAGWAIDPYIVDELRTALSEAFARPGVRPNIIERFGAGEMRRRVSDALDLLFAGRR